MLVGVSLGFAAMRPAPASADGLWTGNAVGEGANIRSAPSASAAIVGTIAPNAPVTIARWALGETVYGTNDFWGEIAPGQNVYSHSLVKPKPSAPPPTPTTLSGRWIDVNLTQQIATAYTGTQPVYWAVVSTGRPGWETPTGTFSILRRVPNERMRSSSLPASEVVSEPYDLSNVLYTQYFTRYGVALHDNYWKWDSPFGVPTSHGCVGMAKSDALYFWNFATVGMPVVVHY